MLIAWDGQEASYFSGGKVTVGVEFVEFGHGLRATPEAVEDGRRLRLLPAIEPGR